MIHMKSQFQNMIEKSNKMFNERLNNLSQEIRANSDSIKQLKDNTRDLEESLTVNQSQLKVVENGVSENRVELKEQLRIQEERSRRNNIRVDGIEEDENETWENTENKLRSFLHNELEITDELYIERAYRVRRRENVKSISYNTPRTIVGKLLDFKEKEEIMRQRYKLKDSVRENFS